MRLILFAFALVFFGAAHNASAQQGVFGFTGAPNTNGLTQTAVTCANTSTPFGVTGLTYLAVQVPANATQNVCFAWNSAAATTSPPSECFGVGSVISWGGGTGSCIVATGTQAVTVETK